jgi:SAM-dependent methyltransferase
MSHKEPKIEMDPDSSCERKRWLYLITLPCNLLLTGWVALKKVAGLKPEIHTFWVDGISLPARRIKEGAGSWRALDVIYNHRFGQEVGFTGRLNDYWLAILNAQAVRNRLKLVKRELVRAIRDMAQRESEVRLLSLASGSAQGVIEAIAETSDINVKVTLLDLDATAIEYSKKLAEEYGVSRQISFIVGSTSHFEKAGDGLKPHIIEMVGFLDYRPDAKAVRLVRRIYEFLAPGGRFLTANIISNPERYFLLWVLNWGMIYRKPEELADIIIKAGFLPEQCRIICEPHKIHAVAVCHKP